MPGGGIFSQCLEKLAAEDAAAAEAATASEVPTAAAPPPMAAPIAAPTAARSAPAAGSASAAATELSIVPRAGLAIIHFPSTRLERGCVPDPRTLHESEVAVDAKDIVQQFVWPVPMSGGGAEPAALHEDVLAEWRAILDGSR